MNPKSTLFLALEFAASSVKFVKIRRLGDRFQLLMAKTMPVDLNKDTETREKIYSEIAQKLLAAEDLRNTRIFVCVNSLHTCFSSFILPKLRRREIAETLKWKIKDEIPFPVEEAVIDYRLFPDQGEDKSQLLALVAATPSESILSHSKLLAEIKSNSYSFPAVCFSIKQLVSIPKEEVAVVLDIGYSVTEIAIYSEGTLSFLRKIAFGAHSLIQSMTQPLISEKGKICLTSEEAEKAISLENLFDQNNQTLLADKIELSRLYPLIRPEFEKLADEISRSLDYFMQQHGKSASQIYLTGGVSGLKGLSDFLFQKLQTSIQILNLSKTLELEQPPDRNLNFFYRPISLVFDRATLPTSRLSLNQPIYSMNLTKALMILISVWVLVTCSLSWRSYEINQKQKVVMTELDNLKIGYGEAQKIEQLQIQNQKGEALRSKILINEPNWTEVFRELSNVFPRDVLLKEVNFDQKKLTVNGIFKSGDENSVSQILLALEGPVLKNVTLVNIEKKENVTEFSIRMDVI